MNPDLQRSPYFRLMFSYLMMTVITVGGLLVLGLVIKYTPFHRIWLGDSTEIDKRTLMEHLPRVSPPVRLEEPAHPTLAARAPNAGKSVVELTPVDTSLLVVVVLLVTATGLYFGRRQLRVWRESPDKVRKDERLTRVRFRHLEVMMRDDKAPTDFLKAYRNRRITRPAAIPQSKASDPGEAEETENSAIADRLARIASGSEANP